MIIRSAIAALGSGTTLPLLDNGCSYSWLGGLGWSRDGDGGWYACETKPGVIGCISRDDGSLQCAR